MRLLPTTIHNTHVARSASDTERIAIRIDPNQIGHLELDISQRVRPQCQRGRAGRLTIEGIGDTTWRDGGIGDGNVHAQPGGGPDRRRRRFGERCPTRDRGPAPAPRVGAPGMDTRAWPTFSHAIHQARHAEQERE
jgi:hypothetical protein